MTSPMQKKCFVIMPISDVEGYEVGHFNRVYDHLIRPACISADIDVDRADKVTSTNFIVLDILQKIVKSDLVICDLSARNANVMFELGIRQAFSLPVVLIKDGRTERVFDIQGLRTLDYAESLRIDSVENDKKNLVETIRSTLTMPNHEVNSLVGLLGMEPAIVNKTAKVSSEGALILLALQDVSGRLATLETANARSGFSGKLSSVRGADVRMHQFVLADGRVLRRGQSVYDSTATPRVIGYLEDIGPEGALVSRRSGGEAFLIPPDHDDFKQLIASGSIPSTP